MSSGTAGTTPEHPAPSDGARDDRGGEGGGGLPRGAAGAAAGGFVLLALLLASVNLRAHIASLPPVVDDVAASLGLTSAGVGLLTSVPVLCFALFTPAASALTARVGPERAITLGLLGILGGTLLRSTGSVTTAMVGTTVLGVGITIGNVAVPVVIARDFRDRAASVTGAYAATMNAGSTVTTLLTVPLAVAYGWQWALAGWGVLAVVALVAWVPAGRGLARHHRAVAAVAASAAGTEATDRPPGTDGRATDAAQRRLVVLLTLAFAGQASGYYAMTAWLPSVLADRVGLAPAAAGGGAAPFQLAAVAGAFLVPLALSRRVSARVVAIVLSAMWIALPAGLLLVPDLWLAWVCLAGAAQGGTFTVILTLLAQRSPTVAAARRGSAVVQTAGYACAAAAPTVLGAVHESTGGWTVPLLVVLALLVVMAVALWTASRPTYLDR